MLRKAVSGIMLTLLLISMLAVAFNIQTVSAEVGYLDISVSDNPDPFNPLYEQNTITITNEGTVPCAEVTLSILSIEVIDRNWQWENVNPSFSVQAVWDGRDGAGNIVDAGTYNYRAIGTYGSFQDAKTGTITVVLGNTWYVPDNYPTIQEAINAANPGDTVLVYPGTYIENVDVAKSLTIKSESGAEVTVVQAVNPNDHVFEITADYVNIIGFTVKGAAETWKVGIYLKGVGYCSVSDSIASNNYVGIYSYYSGNNDLINNIALNNYYAGIRLGHTGYNSLTNNILSDNILGIELVSSSNNDLTNNIALNNEYGIGLYYLGNNYLTNNIASNNYVGIHIFSSSNNIIYLNDFIDNEYNVYSSDSTNVWNSPEKIIYTYDGNTYTNYLGNYWDDYTGSDADGDGIGDAPYSIDSDKDNYPLMEPFENYLLVPALPVLITQDDVDFSVLDKLFTSFAEVTAVSDPSPLFVQGSVEGYDQKVNIVLMASKPRIEAYRLVRIRTPQVEDSSYLKLIVVFESSPTGCYKTLIQNFIINEYQAWKYEFGEKLFYEVVKAVVAPIIDVDLTPLSFLFSYVDCVEHGIAVTLRGWTPGEEYLVYLPVGLNLAVEPTRDLSTAPCIIQTTPWYFCKDLPGQVQGEWKGMFLISDNVADIYVPIKETENWWAKFFELFSPGELRVYDSYGRVTGLVNGQIREDIPHSRYVENNNVVGIFFPTDSYTTEVKGIVAGTYRLEIVSVANGEVSTVTATSIPTSLGAAHQYTVDWDALSEGEEGVTVQIDSDGDGIFEHTFTSDSELTQSKYVHACILKVIADLQAAKLLTTNKHTLKEIDRAIDHIQKGLDPNLWAEVSGLDPKHGHKFFDEGKKAVKHLIKILKDKKEEQTVKDQVLKVIDNLMKADELLANTAINDVKALGSADPKVIHKIEKAEKELAKAKEEITRERYDHAVDHFKRAWRYAQQAQSHVS